MWGGSLVLRANESDPGQIGYLIISIQICFRDSLLQRFNCMIPGGKCSFLLSSTALTSLEKPMQCSMWVAPLPPHKRTRMATCINLCLYSNKFAANHQGNASELAPVPLLFCASNISCLHRKPHAFRPHESIWKCSAHTNQVLCPYYLITIFT